MEHGLINCSRTFPIEFVVYLVVHSKVLASLDALVAT